LWMKLATGHSNINHVSKWVLFYYCFLDYKRKEWVTKGFRQGW
jgi:hypothetical protein